MEAKRKESKKKRKHEFRTEVQDNKLFGCKVTLPAVLAFLRGSSRRLPNQWPRALWLGHASFVLLQSEKVNWRVQRTTHLAQAHNIFPNA